MTKNYYQSNMQLIDKIVVWAKGMISDNYALMEMDCGNYAMLQIQDNNSI